MWTLATFQGVSNISLQKDEKKEKLSSIVNYMIQNKKKKYIGIEFDKIMIR